MLFRHIVADVALLEVYHDGSELDDVNTDG